ncbi:MAG TPA: hypothetical protein ENL06_01160 [Candidatus Portnoybacteria bacterium]|nr:hypothetical protein [Candidatus Portnoybacteria bacterium]
MKKIIYKILKKSEKITGTDNIYLAKSGFWLGLNNFFQMISVFAISVIFANLLDPATYGQYKYLVSLFGILSVFSLPAINMTLIQSVARGYEGNLEKSFWEKLKWSCLGSLIAIILGFYYFWKGNFSLALPVFLAAMFLPVFQASNIYVTFLNAQKLFKDQVKYTLINRTIFVVGIILVLFLTRNIFWIFFTYLFLNSLTNFSLYYWVKNKIKHNQKIDSQSINYGKHLSFLGLVGGLTSYLDKILIFHYLGAAPLAIFSFALSPITQTRGILNNLPILAVPKLAQKSIPEIETTIKKRFWQTLILGTIIAVFYVLLIPYLFYIFYPKYIASIYYSQIMAILIVLSLPLFYLSSIVQAKITLYPKKWFYISISRSIIFILYLVPLVKFFGIMGAIIAQIISSIIGYLYFYIGWKWFLKKE